MNFEWDARKAASNLRKHGVPFFEAMEVFGDPLSSTVLDPDQPSHERRFLTFGLTSGSRHLVVAYTERSDVLRIISARQMTSRERRAYEA